MRHLLIVVTTMLLAASACGSTQDADDALPFDAVLVEVFGTSDLTRYRYDIERDAETALIECMGAAGFTFELNEPLAPRPTSNQLASEEFVEVEGFGIVSEFRRWLESADFETQRDDPNRDYLQTLTGEEIQQFLVTLDGLPAVPGQIAENAGCRGAARDSAFADWDRFRGAIPNFTAMAEERDTHPGWDAARAEWRQCLLGRGYDYSEPDAIKSDVENRMDQAVVEVYPDGRVPLILVDGEWKLDPDVEPLLDELAEFELAAAAANFECTEPLLDQFTAVEREVQQGFVDRNQDAIDALLAASG